MLVHPVMVGPPTAYGAVRVCPISGGLLYWAAMKRISLPMARTGHAVLWGLWVVVATRLAGGRRDP